MVNSSERWLFPISADQCVQNTEFIIMQHELCTRDINLVMMFNGCCVHINSFFCNITKHLRKDKERNLCLIKGSDPLFNKIYSEKGIPITALWCPAFISHGYAWNTSAYYSYYFDYFLPFKEPCRTLGIYRIAGNIDENYVWWFTQKRQLAVSNICDFFTSSLFFLQSKSRQTRLRGVFSTFLK